MLHGHRLQAPEVFTNAKIHDKADIYALGIIMNECLTRQAPFENYEMPFQVIFLRSSSPSKQAAVTR